MLDAVDQRGGFSPGLAARLSLADGRWVFVKAVGLARDPDTPDMFRREAEVLTGLPESLPVPRLLASYDDGDWVALVIEDVDGCTPDEPWRPDQLDRVLDALAVLAEQLDPSPIEAPPITELLAGAFVGWRTLAAEPVEAAWLDPALRARLDQLAELEAGWVDAAAGTSLLHADLRADNILLTGDRVVIVDWPHACLGAGWVDPLLLLTSVAMHGGAAIPAWRRYRPARTVEPEAVDAVLAALAGFLLRQSLRPPPLNIPHIREFQRAQASAALGWLMSRRGW